jgi:hypothetical protein
VQADRNCQLIIKSRAIQPGRTIVKKCPVPLLLGPAIASLNVAGIGVLVTGALSAGSEAAGAHVTTGLGLGTISRDRDS